MLSPDIIIRTKPSSRTNSFRDGTFTWLASLRPFERAKWLRKDYKQRREAACVPEDEIARRATVGLQIKAHLATMPIPKHRALVPVGRVKRRRAKR